MHRNCWQFLSPLLALGLLASSYIPCVAQSTDTELSLLEPLGFIPPPKREKGEPIGPKRAGTARPTEECGGLDLLALVPNQDRLLTITSHPTFWFYVAPGQDRLAAAKCALKFQLVDNKTGRVHATEQVKGPAPVGLFKVTVPESLPPLETERLYRWRLWLEDADGEKTTIRAYGDIERQESPKQDEGETGSSRKRLLAYGKKGYWLEVLDGLINQQMVEARQQVVDWRMLLKSVGICCSPIVKNPKTGETLATRIQCIDELTPKYLKQ